jgi:hypothetical protein
MRFVLDSLFLAAALRVFHPSVVLVVAVLIVWGLYALYRLGQFCRARGLPRPHPDVSATPNGLSDAGQYPLRLAERYPLGHGDRTNPIN